jgi:hypothetical protein
MARHFPTHDGCPIEDFTGVMGQCLARFRQSHPAAAIWSLKGYQECLQKLGRFEEAATIRGKIDKLEQSSDVAIRFSCFYRKA